MGLPLQHLHEIFEPDPRSTFAARLDAAGQAPKTIEDHYGDTTAIRLFEGVPAAIREQFDTQGGKRSHEDRHELTVIPAQLYSPQDCVLGPPDHPAHPISFAHGRGCRSGRREKN